MVRRARKPSTLEACGPTVISVCSVISLHFINQLFHINELIQIHRRQTQIDPGCRRHSLHSPRQCSPSHNRLTTGNTPTDDCRLIFEKTISCLNLCKQRLSAKRKEEKLVDHRFLLPTCLGEQSLRQCLALLEHKFTIHQGQCLQ